MNLQMQQNYMILYSYIMLYEKSAKQYGEYRLDIDTGRVGKVI